MKALKIHDLPVNQALDADDMAAVRGGYCGMPQMPSCCGYPFNVQAPSSSVTTNIALSQANNQFQSNATGNGSAVFGGSISACNNQQGFNSIG